MVAVAAGFAVVVASSTDHRRTGSSTTLDRDLDGRADPIDWNPQTGRWRLGTDAEQLGGSGRVAVPADWDGDGRVDAATWAPTTGEWVLPGRPEASVGLEGDAPVPCDWDGNGSVDPAVWRPTDGGWFSPDRLMATLGDVGDVPVPGPWKGGSTCRPAVFRASDGQWPGTGHRTPFGLPGDIPVVGDWTGDGVLDRAVWRPSTGEWWVDEHGTARVVARLGGPSDAPVPADWDGDGTIDPGIWSPRGGTWMLDADRTVARSAAGHAPLELPVEVRLTFGTEARADGTPGAQPPAIEPAAPRRRPRPTALIVALLAALLGGWAGRRLAPAADPSPPHLPAAPGLLLLAAVATAPAGRVRLGSATVSDVLLVAALVAWLVAAGRAGRRPTRPRTTLVAYSVPAGALALLGGLVGGIVGTTGPVGYLALARAAFGVAIPLLVLAVVPERLADLRRLAVAFSAGAAASVVLGFDRFAADGRLSGLANHPNHLGLACLLGIAAGMAALASGLRPQLAGGAVGLNFVGLILSGSRSALLGVVVLGAGAIWILAGRGRRAAPTASTAPTREPVERRVLVRRASLALAALVALAVVVVQGSGWSRLAGDPMSDSGRLYRMSLALDRIRRAPFTGEGFRFLEEAHSVPLQLLAAGGPLTLLGGGFLLALPLVATRRARFDPAMLWLGTGWAAFLTGALVQNILVDRYVWVFAGLLLATGTQSAHAEPIRASVPEGVGDYPSPRWMDRA